MSNKKKLKDHCERATFLVEKQLCTKLSIWEYIYKNVHLAGCSMCRIYEKQSRMIDKMVSKIFKKDPPALQTDEAFKNSLHSKIDEQLK